MAVASERNPPAREGSLSLGPSERVSLATTSAQGTRRIPLGSRACDPITVLAGPDRWKL